MTNHNKVVIFSHGFGLRKDNRRLFTELSSQLVSKGVITILFDYNKFDESKKELYTTPFNSQAVILQKTIDEAAAKYPESQLIIIGQSQGCIIPTLCDLSKITEVIGICPFFHTSMSDIVRRYTSKKENVLDFSNESRRVRSDGSTTIIPASYWKERFNTDVPNLYNNTAVKTRLTLINALQDEIMDITELKKIKNTFIINLDGDHDFSAQFRAPLTQLILNEIFR